MYIHKLTRSSHLQTLLRVTHTKNKRFKQPKTNTLKSAKQKGKDNRKNNKSKK